jgi:hypothetical protein
MPGLGEPGIRRRDQCRVQCRHSAARLSRRVPGGTPRARGTAARGFLDIIIMMMRHGGPRRYLRRREDVVPAAIRAIPARRRQRARRLARSGHPSCSNRNRTTRPGRLLGPKMR